MAIIEMPEGVELDMKIYLVGRISGVETEIILTVQGLKGFADTLLESVDIESLRLTYRLDELGEDWRVMTRQEIADYKSQQSDDDDEVTFN